MILAQSIGVRTGVFQDLKEESAIPPGFSDLKISFTVKTHASNFHILERSTKGTPDYALILNIDGQGATVKGAMNEEDTREEQPRTPETGKGMRYRFQKALRLKAGIHTVFIGVPEDGVAIEKEIRLEDGTRNELVVEPEYGHGKRFGKRGPNFYSHLVGMRLMMSGKPL